MEEEKTVCISVYMPPAMKSDIEKAAYEEDRTISNMIRRLLEEALVNRAYEAENG